MTGCRALSKEETEKVAQSFTGRYKNRNRLLFVLGLQTGFRISELLSIRLEDVYRDGNVLDYVSVRAKDTKTGRGRELKIHDKTKSYIRAWIEDEVRPPYQYLFSSRKGGHINRFQAHHVLKQAFNEAGLSGKLATHTMRKTFAMRLYEHTDSVHKVSRRLGHQSVAVTERYLDLDMGSWEEQSDYIMSSLG